MKRVALITLLSCAAATPPTRPPFRGESNETWLVSEVSDLRRNDLLFAFDESARSHGCSTLELGGEATPNIGGQLRTFYGISASCEEGVIAIVTLAGDRVRIGCARPITREDCDLLLRKIALAR
jgi:hypothetical protein